VSKRRVVITGLGIVSPVGSTVDEAWKNVVDGVSGIAPITRFDVSAFPCRFGGAVKGFNVDEYMSPKEARRMDEFMHYGIAAGVQAMSDSARSTSTAPA
jgi:3-oxoacyl-[acyl-carrier-protein] synthase II